MVPPFSFQECPPCVGRDHTCSQPSPGKKWSYLHVSMCRGPQGICILLSQESLPLLCFLEWSCTAPSPPKHILLLAVSPTSQELPSLLAWPSSRREYPTHPSRHSAAPTHQSSVWTESGRAGSGWWGRAGAVVSTELCVGLFDPTCWGSTPLRMCLCPSHGHSATLGHFACYMWQC